MLGGTASGRGLRGLTPAGSALVLAILVIMSALAAWAVPARQVAKERSAELREVSRSPAGEQGDMALYRLIAERVAAGEDYYRAATEENRAHNYPVKPFVAVRLPTLAWLAARLGETGLQAALVLLLAASAFALSRIFSTGKTAIGVAAAVLAGGVAVMVPDAKYMHEIWAGLLLSLSFALWRPERCWPALIPAALALALRETALPFVLLWAAFAVAERRWAELAALLALMALFAAGIAFHAMAVADVILPGDAASQGWAGMLGPPTFLQGVQMLTLLVVLPEWIAGPVVVLALFGFAVTGGRQGAFALLYIVGMIVMVSIFARLENWYWAALALPLLFAGLALAPAGLADLIAGLRGGRLAGRNGHHG